MKWIFLSSFLLISVEAQRRKGPCSDGGRPTCADRSRPTPQVRKPPLCRNGANPVCSDGNPPPRPGPCDDGSEPMCGSVPPMCPDGSALRTFGRPCQRGIPKCKDRSIRPTCADGGKPFGRPSGTPGKPFSGTLGKPGRPFNGPSGAPGKPISGPSATTEPTQQQGTLNQPGKGLFLLFMIIVFVFELILLNLK